MITYAQLSKYPFNRREAILLAAFESYLNQQMTLPLETEDVEPTPSFRKPAPKPPLVSTYTLDRII